MALDLRDIGLTPAVDAPTQQSPSAPAGKTTSGLIPGSPLARALYSVWSGTECVIVKSPPGGGKSTLIAQLAQMLKEGLDTTITILTPTNSAGIALAQRINAAFGEGTAWGGSSGISAVVPHRSSDSDTARIIVRTVASAVMSNPGPSGIVIIDEAYQVSYADACDALRAASQVVLVGDPGQIGPVVTIDTSLFTARTYGPHIPAPQVLETIPGAEVVSIEATYRLGPDTTEVVSCLYDFPFVSRRAPQEIDGYAEIETLGLPTAESTHDPDMLDAIVDRVVEMVGSTHVHTTESGQVESDTIKGWHIAVVVAHNVQSAYLAGRLAALSHQGNMLDMVTVGTADRMQGGQWPVVIALDPMAGVDTVSEHHTSLGRLCVMLSRHTSHLTFVHEDSWRARLAEAETTPASQAAQHREIRKLLGI